MDNNTAKTCKQHMKDQTPISTGSVWMMIVIGIAAIFTVGGGGGGRGIVVAFGE